MHLDPKDTAPGISALALQPRRFNRAFFATVWALAKPYFMHSEDRWKARGFLLAIIATTLLLVTINLQITDWYNRFYNALQNYDQPGFWKLLGEFALLAFGAIALSVYQTYLSQLLDLRWRRWLTGDYLARYLSAQTYYHMEVFQRGQDNPDQRIADDLNMFSQLTTSLFTGILSSVANLVAFVGLLWVLSSKVVIPWGGAEHHIPGFLVWVALIYAVAWTWVAAKVGNPLIWLNFNQQRLQADFRFSLVRLRENSEAVAFYGGEHKEQALFTDRFDRVFDNYKRLILRQKRFNWFSSYFSQVAVILPFLAAAAAYFTKAVPLGFLMQVSSAFGNVQSAFAYIAQSYDNFAQWHAVVDRLHGFRRQVAAVETLHENQEQIHRVPLAQNETATLSVRGLSILLPNGHTLINHLNLTVLPGEHLLIMGQSGAGKSTLLRGLAGIWPFGRGQVALPVGASTLFLPQRPYLPLGTLRDVLLYPQAANTTADDILLEILAQVGLPALGDLLDAIEPWPQILSLGEQQRIAMARIILQQPQLVFMDEATSALDEPSEQALYQLIFKLMPTLTVVSVGHRATLRALHERRWVLDNAQLLETPMIDQRLD
ncbi:MAG: ABC transporter ATP-binding protein [Halothiobacillus sp. 24-54-40]|jgi:putative ATP-binding cassette transporter|nr:MAG: ABC transporter ATP-binding protein [Halothiobacillus sp. 35-54-62]OYY55517.1 MAG: ABC transporter ATP-binding protein [Halothiobacillus sp. 28-55-5]OYZ87661.1 MAG: ABC transporter ATP-binding protein [Halothiobacillus sp. 24-54-40]OZA81154.1 MAG: ABC transporter ATP-binding protein [Halothiobacillus sp. 39-53-45]HQS03025.1 ABC transporter ATP-binding protein/permease [Halothiobacillus sp.]